MERWRGEEIESRWGGMEVRGVEAERWGMEREVETGWSRRWGGGDRAKVVIQWYDSTKEVDMM